VIGCVNCWVNHQLGWDCDCNCHKLFDEKKVE
jgi:hypothetical protein